MFVTPFTTPNHVFLQHDQGRSFSKQVNAEAEEKGMYETAKEE